MVKYVKVDDDVYQRLVRIAGLLQYRKGEHVDLKGVVRFLAEYYCRKENLEI